MLTLLEHVEDDASIVLAPSAVVNTYCRQHSDCIEVATVKRIIDHLEAKILEILASDLSQRNNREKVFP